MNKKLWLAAISLGACLRCANAADVAADGGTKLDLKINGPTMVEALIQFSQQTGLQLVFATDDAADIRAPRVEGNLTPRAALDELLKGSGLTFHFVNPRTISVSARGAPAATAP